MQRINSVGMWMGFLGCLVAIGAAESSGPSVFRTATARSHGGLVWAQQKGNEVAIFSPAGRLRGKFSLSPGEQLKGVEGETVVTVGPCEPPLTSEEARCQTNFYSWAGAKLRAVGEPAVLGGTGAFSLTVDGKAAWEEVTIQPPHPLWQQLAFSQEEQGNLQVLVHQIALDDGRESFIGHRQLAACATAPLEGQSLGRQFVPTVVLTLGGDDYLFALSDHRLAMLLRWEKNQCRWRLWLDKDPDSPFSASRVADLRWPQALLISPRGGLVELNLETGERKVVLDLRQAPSLAQALGKARPAIFASQRPDIRLWAQQLGESKVEQRRLELKAAYYLSGKKLLLVGQPSDLWGPEAVQLRWALVWDGERQEVAGQELLDAARQRKLLPPDWRPEELELLPLASGKVSVYHQGRWVPLW